MTDLTHDGITQPISEWALDYGIPSRLISYRLSKGWTVANAITKPMKAYPGEQLQDDASPRHQSIEHNGQTLSIPQWARLSGIKASTLAYRLKKGWPVDLALSTPARSRTDQSSLTHNGKTMSLVEWAASVGVKIETLRSRLIQGMPVAQALTARLFKHGEMKRGIDRG